MSWSQDAPAAADAAIAWARANGAQRVTLVGASVGGTVATVAAGQSGSAEQSGSTGASTGQADPTEHADAVVDLSGPDRFSTLDAEAAVPLLTVPTLFAVSTDDAVVPADEVKQLSTTGKGQPTRFVEIAAGSGHGWDLLGTASGWTPLALRIAGWAKGTYT